MKWRTKIQIGSVVVILGCIVVLAIFNIRRTKADEKIALAAQTSPVQKITVAMKWFFAPTMAPYFFAEKNGIFNKYGLEVKLAPGGPVDTSINQVMTGRAQYGVAGANEIVQARAQDLPLVAVAALFRKSPVCLLSLKRSDINVAKDLIGRKIQVNPGDHADLEITAMLKNNGISVDQVKKATFNFTYDQLLSGTCDAAVAYFNDQPISVQAAHPQLKFSTLVVHKDVGGYADVLFTTENRILQHREEVLAAVESFIESWRQSFANPHEAADAFINDARIRDIESLNIWNQQMVVQAIERSRDFVLDDEQIKDPTAQIGLQNEKSWGETIRLMTSLNLPKTPQAKDCFSNEFVQTHILKRESLK